MATRIKKKFNDLCSMAPAERIALEESSIEGLNPNQYVAPQSRPNDPQKYGVFKYRLPGSPNKFKHFALSEDEIAEKLRGSFAEMDRANRERANLGKPLDSPYTRLLKENHDAWVNGMNALNPDRMNTLKSEKIDPQKALVGPECAI